MKSETVLRNEFFTAEKLTDRVIRIVGIAGELCYLVLGDKKALLIDGLCGVGSLQRFVSQLTGLPVTMAVTHGHIDHVGAAWEYRECFLHPADIPLMYLPQNSAPEERLAFVNARRNLGMSRAEPLLEDVPVPQPVKTIPIYEGDRFDLGGVSLEAVAVPGHTGGSLVFLDREAKLLFSGDACNANTILLGVGSTSVEEYAESLRHLRDYQPCFDVMLGGHNRAAVPNTIVDDALRLCDRIMARTDDAQAMRLWDGREGCFASARDEHGLPRCGGYANILYDPKRIFIGEAHGTGHVL